jgi:hypothetical protein
LSALTKTLVILLTLAAIFLCGIVATYVANADNFRQLYERERTRADSATAKQNNAVKQFQQEKGDFELREAELKKKLVSLQTQISNHENQLKATEREIRNRENERDGAVSVAEGLKQTNAHLTEMLDSKLEQLKQTQEQQIKQAKDLEETTAELIAKIAIIATLQADKKRLEEEKHHLQSEWDRMLRRFGQETAPPPAVTPKVAVARPTPPVTKPIGLKGTLAAIDLKNGFAEISIGTAHGVARDMKFFVTRGDEFICEILIIDVGPEKAVGILERLRPRAQPRVGDSVQTNL